MLVSSFNLSQPFNYAPYLYCKKGSNQRSIVSVYGPKEGKHLVWFGEMDRKISQIINEYIYLPFFLLFIL